MEMHSNVSVVPALPLLVTVDEVARSLRVSTRYVRSLLRRGAIPVVRLGRRTLVRRADMDAIVARGGLESEPR
jgi:excisionase family DNA binding protein